MTLRAMNAYRRSQGEEPLTREKDFSLPSDSPLYTKYTLRAEDLKFIGSSGSQRSMPYLSLAEFLTERFHCTQELLSQLNPTVKIGALKVGDELTVPDVEPFQIEDITPTAALPEVPELRSRSIHISLRDRYLELTDEGKLVAAFPITVGSPSLPTPKGQWRIYGISLMPVFRWDSGVLNHGVRTNNFRLMPPGPNNPVGVVWCGLNKAGIGIHGTPNPETIGGALSHGCMRVANWDVIRLTKLISPGIAVVIE